MSNTQTAERETTQSIDAKKQHEIAERSDRLMTSRPTDASAILTIIERASTDPSVDIDKLERMVNLYESQLARQAESAFNRAMVTAQEEMGPVRANANNPQTHSKYATYAALDSALRPTYTKHGFALSFDTGDAPTPDVVRVLCYVMHTDGFTRTYKVDMPADGKGAKGGDVMTRTHATGAGMSYGQRYLVKFIFNISVATDKDGNGASAPPRTANDPKRQKLIKRLSDAAEQGNDVFLNEWKKLDRDDRNLVGRDEYNGLKRRAEKGA